MSQAPQARVFVTQEMPKLDYTPAEKFGEVVFLARNDFSPVASSLINVDLMGSIKSGLKNFNESVDYVVFSGSPIVAAAVFAQLGKTVQSIRLLRWNNRDNTYTPMRINL